MKPIKDIINVHESSVRSYVRVFPSVFSKAKGSTIWSEDGERFIDFFAGAGALNYGHNDPAQVDAIVEYIRSDGIVHSLDMATTAKTAFIQALDGLILRPRNLEYKMQFTGPTGANAVEAALKLARLKTKRTNIIAFTHSFHGVSLGALATTSNSWFRQASGTTLNDVSFFPYDRYIKGLDSIAYLEKMLDDTSSGLDTPAAILVETIQGEGGVNVATSEWLQRLRELTSKRNIILIVDDIQAGCGRSGDFFSFENSDIEPDMVVLSKSISGFGLPMSVLLYKPEFDIWKPGQHNGTFRGNNLAFITAASALHTYWSSDVFSLEVKKKSAHLHARLTQLVDEHRDVFVEARGRGLMYGLECKDENFAASLRDQCYTQGLVIETAGARDEVIKFMPALTITQEELREGIDKFTHALTACKNAKDEAE